MPRYKIVVEAKGPLLLGESLPADNVRSSRSFVAGSVLRGVVARAILQPLGLWASSSALPLQKLETPRPFAEVFLAEPVARFGFLYPVRAGRVVADQCDAFPLPLTAHTCKAHKGFKVDEGHGVFDRLITSLRQNQNLDPDTKWLSACPECNERLDRLRGFAIREAVSPVTFRQAKAAPHTFVRVGLNRWTETAAENILYTLEALVPGPEQTKGRTELPLSFVGYWTMTEAQWATLKGLLVEHVPQRGGGYTLRLGSARARGMGEAILYLPDEAEADPDITGRLEKFQPRDNQGTRLDPIRDYFSLTLHAPVLIYDLFGRPTPKVTAEVLTNYLKLPTGLEPIQRATFVEQETWSGWSAVWGLPKPVTPALAPGSVLTFAAPAANRPEVLAFLKAAETQGLGERRAEGWGEVTVCDPFHLHFDGGYKQ